MSEQNNPVEIKIKYLNIKKLIKIYLINKKGRLRIFGKDFVKNNKDKCEIIYEENKYYLKEFLDEIDLNYKNKNEIELILKISEDICDMSSMFYECETLKSFPESQSYCNNNLDSDNSKVSELSNELYKNNSSYEKSKIPSKNDNKNSSGLNDLNECCKGINPIIKCKIKNISYMFYGCKSLESLPDILSILDTSGVTDMSHMFHFCTSLKSIPDISGWETNNVTNMSGMFNQCSSLEYLPDISKWKTEKVEDFSFIFFGCELLKELPDISKWDTSQASNLSNLFFKCKLLLSLPLISKCNTKM